MTGVDKAAAAQVFKTLAETNGETQKRERDEVRGATHEGLARIVEVDRSLVYSYVGESEQARTRHGDLMHALWRLELIRAELEARCEEGLRRQQAIEAEIAAQREHYEGADGALTAAVRLGIVESLRVEVRKIHRLRFRHLFLMSEVRGLLTAATVMIGEIEDADVAEEEW